MIKEFLNELTQRHPALESQSESLILATEQLLESVALGGKIISCGNGGSAADSDHIVGELLKSFCERRKIRDEDQRRVKELFPAHIADELLSNLEGSIPAVSLSSATAFNSAFANDVCYQFAFAQQLYGLGQPKDVLIAISTSGNSKNVINAARVAKIKKMKVIALTGAQGGILGELADVPVKVPAYKVHEIQELHLPVYHFLCYTLEQLLFTAKGQKYVSERYPNQVFFPKH